MAGIYLHIPFCKQACHYCDFHFSTNTSKKSEMVDAIERELVLRKEELRGASVTSVYFGGGTPSLLSVPELDQLLRCIHTTYEVSENAEFTLEANPDDLIGDKLQNMRALGINRLSIGIQTFDDERLKFINRAHTSAEADQCLNAAMAAGFDNVSADLIYAIPPSDMSYWQRDLEKILIYDLSHISLYGLTIEEKTVFGNRAKKGQLKEVKEEISAQQYQLAIDTLTGHGYEHYEVSNFAKAGRHSRHNSSYWDDQTYLGVGPGAHSYDGNTRSSNVSHNTKYLNHLQKGQLPLTIEPLTPTNQINEYLFTHLRTQRGINLSKFRIRFNRDFVSDNESQIQDYLKRELVKWDGETFALTSKGFMLADEISWRLFYDE
ncbi:MAG: radical SAM family heme chaperone HemW [Marinoscillum sp.]|uniref:radical SAM family heme chaperone HemW n=1 Tax=Marinoscillum sp. TaxID=2024838 RepID=UPI0032F4DF1B